MVYIEVVPAIWVTQGDNRDMAENFPAIPEGITFLDADGLRANTTNVGRFTDPGSQEAAHTRRGLRLAPSPQSKVTPKRIATQQRRADALSLRRKGFTYQRIADALGYSSAGEARKQIVVAFDAIVQVPAEELRTLQIERLNTLLSEAWAIAVDTTASAAVRLRAINSASTIIGQTSALMGLGIESSPDSKRAALPFITVTPTADRFIRDQEQLRRVNPDGSNQSA